MTARISVGFSALGLLAAQILSAAAAAAPGQNVSNSNNFSVTANSQYFSKTSGIDYSLINNVYNDSIGGIECGLGACAGAYLAYAVGANIGAYFNTSISNTLLGAYSGKVTTTIGGISGPVQAGQQFLLNNSATISDGLQIFGKGRVTANAGVDLFLGGELIGDVCLGICANPNDNDRIVSLGLGSSKTLEVFNYDSANNSVTFLGQNFSGVLPRDFQADGLPISAHVAAIDLSGAAGLGQTFKSSTEIGGVYLDVAAVVANAFGIPSEAISGSFLGFDYITLSAKLGLALDVVQTVNTNLQALTTYTFSDLVQFRRADEASFSAPTTSFTVGQGETVTLLAGDATSLVVQGETSVFGTVKTSLDLRASIKAPVKLFEITGNGLDIGPAFANEFNISLGNLASTTDETIFFSTGVFGQPITFELLSEFAPVPIKAAFVYVPVVAEQEPGETGYGFYTKVFNFGDVGCTQFVQSGCVIDTSVVPQFAERRTTRGADGLPVFSYSDDFITADRIAAAPRGVYGVQSSVEQLDRRLISLPVADYSLANLPSAVPEPGSWMLLIAGFGLVGAAARRLRGRPAVSQAAPAPHPGRSAAAAPPFRGHAAGR